MERWNGRVALVTGAGSGIGASIAEKLVTCGMKVVGCDKNTETIQEMTFKLEDSQGCLHPVECDLRQEDQILSMFREIKRLYGGVDVCVNCAGLAKIASLMNGETEKWREMLNVNVLALCICTRETIQSMKERGLDDGHIIHMCSLQAHGLMPSIDCPIYYASKCAVKALTRGLRNELIEINSRIRVTSLSPGPTKTAFSTAMRGEKDGMTYYKSNPYLTADDVTEAMIFALSAPAHVQVHDVLIHACSRINSDDN